ncbi:cytochrome b-c1 complex subunit 6, mitochondrial-like [Penaeus monodon]|uniref:cytochrome b-c1 complex subunit 6, mitochondrial-like n=1 Tax=Penaeus monodon TaxID=6687 RepID=UPI0018A7D548|nr:cytochrome b-c1 complex subunit 6, mitochondrial-like [Penaeus monodon]
MRPLNLLVLLVAIISITNAKPVVEDQVNSFETRQKRDLNTYGGDEEEEEESDDNDDEDDDEDAESDGMILMIRQVVGGRGGCAGRRGCP